MDRALSGTLFGSVAPYLVAYLGPVANQNIGY